MPRPKVTGTIYAAQRQGRRRWLIAFVVIAVLVATIKSCTLLTGRTNPVDQAITVLSSPVVYVIKRIGEGFSSLSYIFRIPSLLRDKRSLTEENKLLERRNAELEQMGSENQHLRRLLKLEAPGGFREQMATVIARPYDLWLESAILNVGTGEGVRRGNLVVNDSGVVGRITEAEEHYSRMQLVSSPQFTLAAVSSDSRDEGVVRGVDARTLVFDYIPAGSRITVGEKVFTMGSQSYAGEENSRPRGILIGSVVGRVVDPNGFLHITVEPAAACNQLGYVVVYVK